MGALDRPASRRAPAVGAAVAATVAVVVATVLLGFGAASGTAAGAPAPTAAAVAAPAAPAGPPAAPVPRTAQPRAAARPAGPPAAPAPAPAASDAEPAQPPPAAAPFGGLVPGTPCTTAARACVDLTGHNAWLIKADGSLERGPVKIMIGDLSDPTPRGTFHVQWKAEQYTSREYLVQMPYAVFFADGGVAFHEGRQDTNSAGCVKLNHFDAVAWFNFLQVGDEVQVH